MLNIAIVEDNDREAEILENYINVYGEEHQERFRIERFNNPVGLFENYRFMYDIIFMDIMMPEFNGMDAAIKLRKLDKVVTLIFVTNMAKYAVQGYEVDALDFILKPIGFATFSMKFKKALSKIASDTGYNITVQRKGEIICLSSRKVTYIEVSGHKVKYHMLDENVEEGYGTLSELETQLQICNFLRCNSCYLINPQYISKVQGHVVVLLSGEELLISHPRKKMFMKKLADWLGEGKSTCQ